MTSHILDFPLFVAYLDRCGPETLFCGFFVKKNVGNRHDVKILPADDYALTIRESSSDFCMIVFVISIIFSFTRVTSIAI